MDLSIIIVNYNVKYFLEQCLLSVQRSMAYLKVEVIVVDNASADGSIEYLAPLFPWVRFINNAKNEGFAKANNKALRAVCGKYVLFLNPDTVLQGDTLMKCVDFMNSHLEAGALGIKMYNGEGKFLPESKRGFPSPLAAFFKLAGLTALFPRSPFFARYYLGHLNEIENHEVDILSGAFLFVANEVLKKTGGFDERFFMYAEDIDLSYRIRQAGYRNYYFADSSIVHYKGESTNQDSLHYTKLFYKAMDQFVRKHYSGSRSFLFILLLQTGIGLRASVSGTVNLLRQIKKRIFTNRPNK
ncbi:MAG: glycosyltransferase family 2 protein [Chitinophagaceae bacterium]|nr:glycosyltransferase family 2 protein [Chitinophagaceae bacterium]